MYNYNYAEMQTIEVKNEQGNVIAVRTNRNPLRDNVSLLNWLTSEVMTDGESIDHWTITTNLKTTSIKVIDGIEFFKAIEQQKHRTECCKEPDTALLTAIDKYNEISSK